MKDKIISKLVTMKFPARVATELAEDLMKIDKRLVPLRDAWLTGDESQDFEVCGYSVLRFVKERGMMYHAALLSVDWLLKEPDVTKAELEKGIE